MGAQSALPRCWLLESHLHVLDPHLHVLDPCLRVPDPLHFGVNGQVTFFYPVPGGEEGHGKTFSPKEIILVVLVD